jgi:hypothetical protein
MKRLLTAAAAVLAAAGPAGAEIAVLQDGRTLKVVSHRAEGGMVLLTLRGGGEVGVPSSTVKGFVPDEVAEEVSRIEGGGGQVRRLAEDAAARYGLDPALVLAVVSVESAFQPTAVSPKGAQGLMQLMPRTAASLGVSDPLDPAANLDGGARHLLGLVTRYEGDLVRALAAYNAGERAVDRHGGVPPYRETRSYVSRVLKRYHEAR